MKTNFTAVLIVLTSFMSGPWSVAFADIEMSYDDIVQDLQGSSRASIPQVPDPFDDVLIHATVGVVSSRIQINKPDGTSTSGFLNGVEAGFGIDLFSPHWQAEGTARSYNADRLSSGDRASLKEFDLRLMNTMSLTRQWRFRIGAGLTARYLNLIEPEGAAIRATTPASILATALMVQATKNLAIGADFSWRSALITDTPDRSALNAGLRLDARF